MREEFSQQASAQSLSQREGRRRISFLNMFSFLMPLLEVIKVIIASVASVVFLGFATITLAGSAVALAVSTPLFVIFSPVLVPATVATAVLTTGFTAGSSFLTTALGLIMWLIKRRMGAKPKDNPPPSGLPPNAEGGDAKTLFEMPKPSGGFKLPAWCKNIPVLGGLAGKDKSGSKGGMSGGGGGMSGSEGGMSSGDEGMSGGGGRKSGGGGRKSGGTSGGGGGTSGGGGRKSGGMSGGGGGTSGGEGGMSSGGEGGIAKSVGHRLAGLRSKFGSKGGMSGSEGGMSGSEGGTSGGEGGKHGGGGRGHGGKHGGGGMSGGGGSYVEEE